MLSALPAFFPFRKTSAIVSRESQDRYTMSSARSWAGRVELPLVGQSSLPTHWSVGLVVPDVGVGDLPRREESRVGVPRDTGRHGFPGGGAHKAPFSGKVDLVTLSSAREDSNECGGACLACPRAKALQLHDP